MMLVSLQEYRRENTEPAAAGSVFFSGELQANYLVSSR